MSLDTTTIFLKGQLRWYLFLNQFTTFIRESWRFYYQISFVVLVLPGCSDSSHSHSHTTFLLSSLSHGYIKSVHFLLFAIGLVCNSIVILLVSFISKGCLMMTLQILARLEPLKSWKSGHNLLRFQAIFMTVHGNLQFFILAQYALQIVHLLQTFQATYAWITFASSPSRSISTLLTLFFPLMMNNIAPSHSILAILIVVISYGLQRIFLDTASPVIHLGVPELRTLSFVVLGRGRTWIHGWSTLRRVQYVCDRQQAIFVAIVHYILVINNTTFVFLLHLQILLI